MTAVRLSTLDERYLRQDGTIFLTGIQALVRMLLDRARHDERAGLRTAAYVSGYEGSPLAGYDLELARQAGLLREHRVTHQPGVNEELAATAVSGTQLLGRPGEPGGVGDAIYNGVTGVWYGKAPGLDRATDALRHANLIGTSPTGGAVALVGDDPAAKSSTVPCSSELALADLGLPTFYPADAAEVLLHGLHAVELSRASGLWSAIKVGTAVADGAATAELFAQGWQAPDMGALPGGLVAYRHRPNAQLLGPELAELERGQQVTRLPIALEYIRRSGLNTISGAPRGRARIGLIAAGKTYLDLRQALDLLGLTDPAAHGIRLLKLGVIFPLEPSVVAEFADGLDEIVVVEDKRPFIEDAVKSVLYGRPGAPAVHGKRGRDGSALLRAYGELDADAVTAGLARHLEPLGVPVRTPAARPGAGPAAAGAAHALLLLGVPAQLLHQGRAGHAGRRRDRLPRDGPADAGGAGRLRHRAVADGRRGRAVDRPVAVRRARALRAEHRRRHLHPLRQPGDPGGGRGRGEHHLQAAAELGGGDDRRPAGDGRAADRPAA